MHCVICGEEIVPGEAREPTKEGVKHSDCGATDPPESLLGELEPTEAVDVKINGTWVTATVEGSEALTDEFIVRLVTKDGLIPEGKTDLFDLVVKRSEAGWSQPECHEIIPDFEAMDQADDSVFRYDTESHGEAEIRPASATAR